MGGDPQHRHTRAMAVEQAVDEMQIARAATAGADGEGAGEMRVRAGGEGGYFFMAHMDPFDAAMATDGIGQAIQAVTHDPVNARDTGGGENSR